MAASPVVLPITTATALTKNLAKDGFEVKFGLVPSLVREAVEEAIHGAKDLKALKALPELVGDARAEAEAKLAKFSGTNFLMDFARAKGLPQ